MKFNYALNYTEYSVRNALLWGNCYKHFQQAGEGRLGSRIIHVLIGIAEISPVIGQISSIFEMLIVTRFNDYQDVSTDQRPRKIVSTGNATASEFVSCVNKKLFTGISKLTEQEVQEFLDRGGELNTVSDDEMSKKPIPIHADEQVITGCNSGINRSQVAAAVMKEMKIHVIGVLAGGDSAMNLEADCSSFVNPAEETSYQAATNFKETFKFPKFNQVGREKYPNFLEDKKRVNGAKEFYQNYINQLSGTHFITFGPSGPSVLRRLLKRKGSLQGFTITHIPWGDEVANPPKGLCYSREAYQNFADKLKACFVVSR
jgi:rhodanese-related sulfurtransferase